MTGGRDLALGLGSVVLAGAYFAAADAIPRTALSDAVGAAGVPKLLSIVLGIAGALLVLRAISGRGEAFKATALAAHGKALGLLAILIAYVALAPVLGYPLALGLLAGGVALYAGAAWGTPVAAFAVATGGAFWLGFVKVLGVTMPVGTLFEGP